MTAQNWQNLAIAAVLTFYLIQIGMEVFWRNTCGHLAIDYCTFWSAGQIANKYGYARVYDLDLMSQIQRTIFPATSDLSKFAVVPTPYLPVFILLFQPFALIDPAAGFWLWTALNGAIYFFYLRFFAQEMANEPLQTRLLILLTSSLPVFLNFLYGQVNVWLAVCIGEFMRASISDRRFRAGLWLGGFLIKPQSLILIVPVLLLQRAFRTLAGFASASLLVLGTSFVLMGYDGFATLIRLWLGYATGLPAAIGPQVMMNWRMIGISLNSAFPSRAAWAITAIGLAATLLAVAYIWRRPLGHTGFKYGIGLLGTLAATGLVAWHSHVSTSVILIPPLIYLSQPTNRLPRGTVLLWALVPAAMYFAVFILDLLVHQGILTPNANSLLNFLSGGGAFGLNVYLLFLAVRCLGNPATQLAD